LEDILTYRRQKNYHKLVQAMIRLNDQCIDTIQRHPEVYINFNDVETVIKETITELNQDLAQFLQFAYELRKQDYDDCHTGLLLAENVIPSILTEIVMSNHWDKYARKMRCHSSKKFKILIGENNPLVYHKNPSKNIHEKPQIKK
jgi:uncharacterized protein YlzI (FlbEa/FlbD family)